MAFFEFGLQRRCVRRGRLRRSLARRERRSGDGRKAGSREEVTAVHGIGVVVHDVVLMG